MNGLVCVYCNAVIMFPDYPGNIQIQCPHCGVWYPILKFDICVGVRSCE